MNMYMTVILWHLSSVYGLDLKSFASNA